MYQNLIVPIDHGNRNMKSEQFTYTSGLIESDCKPALGEYLYYRDRFYTLTEQRIPYMRDKTIDNRFFILTLFGIAMEAEKQIVSPRDSILQVDLPIGLPPKHYGALYRKFEDYFKNRGLQSFTYKGLPYEVQIGNVAALSTGLCGGHDGVYKHRGV
jgi:plasmid segregation protein ParM